jgi:hypothetical protein
MSKGKRKTVIGDWKRSIVNQFGGAVSRLMAMRRY